MNQADSFGIERQLRAAGGAMVAPESADVVIVNSCSVTATADQGTRQTIRRVARMNPTAQIVATGCKESRAAAEVAALPGEVAVIPNTEKEKIERFKERYQYKQNVARIQRIADSELKDKIREFMAKLQMKTPDDPFNITEKGKQILLTKRKPPKFKKTSFIKIKELFKISPTGSFSMFCSGFIFSAIFAMLSVYAVTMNLSIFEVSILLVGVTLSGAFFQWPIGYLSDRIDRRIIHVTYTHLTMPTHREV